MNERPLVLRARSLSRHALWCVLVAAAAGWLGLATRSDPVSAKEAPPGTPAAAATWTTEAVVERFPDPDRAAAAASFIGSLECRECHDDRWKSLGTSFHATLLSPKKSGSRGCESCHGPGDAHWEDGGEGPIRHPGKADAEISNGACIACHAEVLTKPVDGHRDWTLPGGPGTTPRRCVHCHSIHVDKAAPAFDASVGPFRNVRALNARAQPVAASQCIGCHPGFHPEMKRSGHAALVSAGEACGTCHGSGSLHLQSGGDPKKIIDPREQTPRDVNASCNACHAKGEAVQRWTCSEHAREGVSCIVCHDANARKGRTLRAPEFELCGSCHQDVKAKFRLSNRHRVPQGRVLCSDCHDPHGNRDRVRDRDVRLRSCGKCHTDKTTPFVHDHGIKRTDGCVACHEPHGSTNRRLLSFSRIRPLCLQCHPETPHDLSQRRFDNCISCHSEIHGSDLDRFFLR